MTVIRRIVSQAIDGCTFTARRGLIKGMRVRGGGSAFLPEGMWPRWQETAETRFLRSLDLRGTVIYDIGALHGHMTLFFAGQARHVIAYEANPASANRIRHNLRLNYIANVTVRNVAVGDHRGALEFTLDPDRPALSSGNSALANRSKRRRSILVQVVRLDEDIVNEGFPQPDLVKIDVEGMELAVLRGMERTLRQIQPKVYVEIHGVDAAQKLANVRGVIDLLQAAGYEQIMHIETQRRVGLSNAPDAREGHLWANA